jgi:hypothetical protein
VLQPQNGEPSLLVRLTIFAPHLQIIFDADSTDGFRRFLSGSPDVNALRTAAVVDVVVLANFRGLLDGFLCRLLPVPAKVPISTNARKARIIHPVWLISVTFSVCHQIFV